MKLSQLRYFLAVFDEGAIARAAVRCNVAQPSIAEAINNLEASLNVQLFSRSRRGLQPTGAARDLYPRARRLIDDANAIALALGKRSPRPLNVFIHPTIANRRFVQVIADLRADAEIDVRLTDETLADIVVGPDDDLGESHSLWSEEYRLAIPRNHTLATRDQIRLDDLKGQKFIARCSCERASAFPTEMLQPTVVAVAENEDRALAMVAAGLGLCVIPGIIEEPGDVVVRSLANFALSRTISAHPLNDNGREVLARSRYGGKASSDKIGRHDSAPARLPKM